MQNGVQPSVLGAGCESIASKASLLLQQLNNNNNNGYFECLTHTGPRLKICNTHTPAHTTHTHAHAHIHAHTHHNTTHTRTHIHRVMDQGNGTEVESFLKRKVFKEDLKLTEVEQND